MELYINTSNGSESAKMAAQTMVLVFGQYFSPIHLNHQDAKKAGALVVMVENDAVIMVQGGEKTSFFHPLKMGQILQTILITQQNTQSQQQSEPIKIGKSILYPQRNVLEKAGKKISLTDKEFDIVKTIFVASPNRLTRGVLLEKIWGYNSEIETHTLETHIYRLRQKIEIDPANPDFLKTDDDGYYLNF